MLAYRICSIFLETKATGKNDFFMFGDWIEDNFEDEDGFSGSHSIPPSLP